MASELLAQGAFAESVLSLPGDLPRQVIAEFTRGWNAQAFMLEREQKRMAAAPQVEAAHVDGLGAVTMQIPPDAFHFWGQKLGYACWKDRAFRREFRRDNPGVRVKSRSRNTCVRVDGFRG